MEHTDSLLASFGNAKRENFEYLVAALSKRTKGKKYENFVVNYIWYALNDPALKPVTQQYVNRRDALASQALIDFNLKASAHAKEEPNDHNFALIDLYFPQLHLGVECDESGHFLRTELGGDVVYQQSEADRRRSKDIHRAIADYHEIRIPVQVAADEEAAAKLAAGEELAENRKVTLEPAEIMASLDRCVEAIRQRKRDVEAGMFSWAKEGLTVWRSDLADWQLARACGEVRVGDGLLYRHNGELRALFDASPEPSTKPSTFSTEFHPGVEGHRVWAPTLSVVEPRGGYRATNSIGVLNVYITEGDEVFIGQADPSPRSASERKRAKAKKPAPLPAWEYTMTPEDYEARPADETWGEQVTRITFVRSRDAVGRSGFQFMGLFKFCPGEYREINGITFMLHRFVGDAFPLAQLEAS